MVNGQAPPGVRTLEDIGRWRCGSCGEWNGRERPGSPFSPGGQSQSQAQSPVSPKDAGEGEMVEVEKREKSEDEVADGPKAVQKDSNADDKEKVEEASPEVGEDHEVDAPLSDDDDSYDEDVTSQETPATTKRLTQSTRKTAS